MSNPIMFIITADTDKITGLYYYVTSLFSLYKQYERMQYMLLPAKATLKAVAYVTEEGSGYFSPIDQRIN